MTYVHEILYLISQQKQKGRFGAKVYCFVYVLICFHLTLPFPHSLLVIVSEG